MCASDVVRKCLAARKASHADPAQQGLVFFLNVLWMGCAQGASVHGGNGPAHLLETFLVAKGFLAGRALRVVGGLKNVLLQGVGRGEQLTAGVARLGHCRTSRIDE